MLSTRARWTAVLILCLVSGNAYVDRQILTLLVQPIRSDLQISDTEFSLLHGLSFALFYAIFGVPIGWWVDRGHRPRILAIGIALWSAFTALCGLSRTYWQLFLWRMGVGVGEATVVPVTYSLLADYFPPHRRGLALGCFGAGVYLGIGAAILLGGMLVSALQRIGPVDVVGIGTVQPWQLALLVVSLPGLVIALLALWLPEPRRTDAIDGTHRERMIAAEAGQAISKWQHYRSNGRAVALHHLTVTFMVMALYAVLAWAPEHLRRTYAMTPAEIGLSVGVVITIAGPLGVLIGGQVSDVLVRKDVRSARLAVLLVCAILAIPASLVFALADSSTVSLAGMAVTIFFVATLSSVGPAGLQEIVPSNLHGFGAAIYQLVANLIGLGLGPTLVALTTDFIFHDDQRLGSSLAITLPIMLLIAVIVAWAGLSPYEQARRKIAATELVRP